MLELCRHKSAAASINWMVNLLKGKANGEQIEAIKALGAMFDAMVVNDCATCPQMTGCHELDGARRILADAHQAPVIESVAPGTPCAPRALMVRGVPRRARANAPTDRLS